MGALLDRFHAAGIVFAALPDGNLRASGALTDAIRATIRAEKQTILAELAANGATPEQAAELRTLVRQVLADRPDEWDEAEAVALADPEAALVCYRALAREREAPVEPRGDPRMRTCRECANLTPAGHCVPALRREPFGAALAVPANYVPTLHDTPQRCGAYAPGPHDPDRRAGAERWSFLFREPIK